MIVYRFERNGIGPYITYYVTGKILRANNGQKSINKMNALRHVYEMSKTDEQVENFKKAHSDDQYMFGCGSKDALRAYFGTSFKALFAEGYRIKKYTVPYDEVLDMGIEVAFPVKYHKLRSKHILKRRVRSIRR